jgi:phosphate transport system substrate-binding protein
LVIAVALSIAGCQHTGAAEQAAGTGRAIENKGSDTMVNLALAWAEEYRSVRPDVTIAVTGGGTGTGIAALLNGTVDLANASRAMKEDEIAAARARGIEPVEREVAIDAIAVIVNLANPVEQLTIDDVADLFTGRITNWRDVGGRDAPVVLVSRESNSGTHVYFLEEVVRRGDKQNKDLFATQTLLMPSSAGITSEVRRNPNAIGYDGLGYVTDEEKPLAIARGPGEPFVHPSVETARRGAYALSRPLLIYSAGQPQGEIASYLDWITGPDGQAIVERLGFVPIGRRADS